MQACPSAEFIDAFLVGRLEHGRRADVEAHVDGCEDCRHLIANLLSRHTEILPPRPLGIATIRGPRAEGDKFGRFILIKCAGAGGMGAVWAAYDTTLDRRIALKFVSGDRGSEAVARVLAEASAMAKLKHPNVVTVYDAGVIDDEPYIAMELVEGHTLAAWRGGIEDGAAKGSGRPPGVREVATVMAGAARGLAAAHAAGIVHRDIKPHNILIEGTRVLVTDFGLSSTSIGGSSGIAGTPGYMAPEQWMDGEIDVRTDVFGFCATLYYMLYGVAPFQGNNLAEIRAAALAGRVSAPPSGRKVPARLHRLALGGLAPDPQARPADLSSIAAALAADPNRGLRRGLAAGAAALGLVAAFYGGAAIKAQPEERCRAGGAVIETVWNDSWRAKVARSFAEVGRGGAWAPLEQRLGSFKSDWRAMHEEICTAGIVEHRQSPDVTDLRMACLARKRATVGTFVQALASATPKQLAEAPGAELPDVGDCAFEARAGTKPLPNGADKRAQIAAISDKLAKIEAAWILGDFEGAEARAGEALAAARALGYEPLIAEALDEAAHMALRRGRETNDSSAVGKRKSAVELYLDAIAAAERGADDQRRAMASTGLISAFTGVGRFSEAEAWATSTAGLLARLGDPVRPRARFEMALGVLHLRRERRDDAKAALSRASELYRKGWGDRHPAALSPMSFACSLSSSTAEERACYQRLLQFAEGVLGPKHPRLSNIYGNLANAIPTGPRTISDACAMEAKAFEIASAGAFEPTSSDFLRSQAAMGECERFLGRLRQSRTKFEQVIAYGAAMPYIRAFALNGLGLVELKSGHLAAAERAVRQSLADRREMYGQAHEEVLISRCSLAEVLLARQQPRLALAEMADALARVGGAAATPSVPRAHLRRGDALLVLRRPEEAAHAYRAAIAAFEQLTGYAEVAPSEAWLGLGQAAAQRGATAEALSHLERAHALASAGDAYPATRAQISLALAEALSRPGGRTRGAAAANPRACQLVGAAVKGLAEAPAFYGEDLSRARALEARLKAACAPEA